VIVFEALETIGERVVAEIGSTANDYTSGLTAGM
jgi:hypothetical protein